MSGHIFVLRVSIWPLSTILIYEYNSQTIVNFEPNSKPQYHLSSSVCNCVDIFREFFVTEEADLKLTMEDFNFVFPVICEGWHFTYMWKSLA
jgi:hypothetical protein